MGAQWTGLSFGGASFGGAFLWCAMDVLGCASLPPTYIDT